MGRQGDAGMPIAQFLAGTDGHNVKTSVAKIFQMITYVFMYCFSVFSPKSQIYYEK